MLVYGDPVRRIDLADWRERLAQPIPSGPAIARHSELVARLILTGQVLQARADALFAAAGERDAETPDMQALNALLLRLARKVGASWTGDAPGPAEEDAPALDGFVEAREPEGYAFYSLYPELYFEAARRLGPQPDALVLGLRSIGTSLAPMVAAGLGARDLASLRPKGPVFAREIDAPALAPRLAAPRIVALVDEGPGLSGSSFAAAAAFAGGHRLHLFPSHAHGPGGEASDATRSLFARAPTHLVSFEDSVLPRLASFVEDLTGPAIAPLEDLSGGAWRRRLTAREEDWPAVDAMQERRKYLLTSARGRFLLKFVGLGEGGARKAALARDLGAAGFAPEQVGFRHGFTIERWLDGARLVDPQRDRAPLLRFIARLLGYRRRRFADAPAFRADKTQLAGMIARNVALALGEDAAREALRAFDRFEETRVRPIASDNRMLAHEFLIADGGIVKTDGVDHHAGHDLIGAQDVAYDIAAASVEFDLNPSETRELTAGVARFAEAEIDASLLRPYRLVFLAFETGRMTLAAQAMGDGAEQARVWSRVRFLTSALERELGRSAWP